MVDIPAGFGRVVNRDKSIVETARALIVKNPEGATPALKTGYPIIPK